jgi:hypothetical protein
MIEQVAGDIRYWHKPAGPPCLLSGRYRRISRRHMLNASSSHFEAEPTIAALNNGLRRSLQRVSTLQPVTGMASCGPQSIYLTIGPQADMEDPERRS